jgi:hypothetical protein
MVVTGAGVVLLLVIVMVPVNVVFISMAIGRFPPRWWPSASFFGPIEQIRKYFFRPLGVLMILLEVVTLIRFLVLPLLG